MIIMQEIESPRNGKITNSDFYTYDPLNEFNKGHNLNYLN